MAAAAGDVVFPPDADVRRASCRDSKIFCGSAGSDIFNGMGHSGCWRPCSSCSCCAAWRNGHHDGRVLGSACWPPRQWACGRHGRCGPGQGSRLTGAGLLRQVVPLMLGFAARHSFYFRRTPCFVNTYFGGGPDGALRSGGDAVARAVMAGAAAGGGDVSQNRPQHGQSGKVEPARLGPGGYSRPGRSAGFWACGFLGRGSSNSCIRRNTLSATRAMLPWYAGAMVPLALANVLVNDLLARSRFQMVPFLVLLAMFYGLALTTISQQFAVTVLKTSGFSTCCCWPSAPGSRGG